MRRDRSSIGAILVAICLVGCSEAEPDEGGQTGSLTPSCLRGVGDAKIVVSDVAFASDEQLESVTLQDSNGRAVPFTLEPFGPSGAVVIRTESTLSPGNYSLTASVPNE
jgi:hypothetical protein